MPVESNGSATIITGNAIKGVRAFYCLQGLQMYAKYGSSFRLTRGATPAVLRQIATEYTGKVYARSGKGMAAALADMTALHERKTLDEMGETRAVNAAVGGVAADLEG